MTEKELLKRKDIAIELLERASHYSGPGGLCLEDAANVISDGGGEGNKHVKHAIKELKGSSGYEDLRKKLIKIYNIPTHKELVKLVRGLQEKVNQP